MAKNTSLPNNSKLNGNLFSMISVFGGVAVAIVAAFGIVSSFINPIQLQIDQLQTSDSKQALQLNKMSELTIRTDVDLGNAKDGFFQHRSLPGHPSTAKELAAQKVQFVEVETQFKNLDERTERMQESFRVALKNLDDQLQREVAVQKDELKNIISNVNETSDTRHQVNKLRIEEMQNKIMIHIENLRAILQILSQRSPLPL